MWVFRGSVAKADFELLDNERRNILGNEKKYALASGYRRLFLLVGVTAMIGGLIYFEQIAVLYVIATFGLIALLLAVAFTDLEAVGRE